MPNRHLILIRHAKSDYPPGVPDHDRPLNARGSVDAPKIGAWLDQHVQLSGSAPLVLVSSANRAQLTWSLASSRLGASWQERVQRTEPLIYEASTRTLMRLVDETPDAIDTLLMIGHNPGLLDLVEHLGVEGAPFLAATEKFPTSAIAVLETGEEWAVSTDVPQRWTVAAFAVPRG